MKAMKTTRPPAQPMAGTVALRAALSTQGRALRLAEHDAHTGAGREASGYDAAGQAARAARRTPDAARPVEPGSRRNARLNINT